MNELVMCYRCNGQYNPDADWVYGRNTEGTTGGFIPYGKIEKGHCPICRKPPQLEKMPIVMPM